MKTTPIISKAINKLTDHTTSIIFMTNSIELTYLSLKYVFNI